MKGIAFYCLLLLASSSAAQTCCSGGVPMSGNIGLPAERAESFQLSFSYDLNLLRRLKSGVEIFNDQSRTRTTQTYLLQMGYQLNERIAIEALAPFIIQRRTIEQFGGTDITETTGIGDLALLVKYMLISDQAWTIRVGAGAKLATGSSTKTFRGITLNADLQPGSGANDVLLWAGIDHSLAWRESMSINAIGLYRITGSNDEYLNSLTYEFGNELSMMVGIADQYSVSTMLVSPSLALRFRQVQTDLQNDFQLPNTGGEFIFLRPGLLINWVPNISLTMHAEIPILSNVGGIQLSPTTRYNIGLLSTIDFSKNESF